MLLQTYCFASSSSISALLRASAAQLYSLPCGRSAGLGRIVTAMSSAAAINGGARGTASTPRLRHSTPTCPSTLRDAQYRASSRLGSPCRTWRFATSAASIRSRRVTVAATSAASMGPSPAQQQQQQRKKKLPPLPCRVPPPPTLPPNMETWQNAMVLIDKPQEWTSFDLCGKLRGALKIKKVGHAGTLDPMATGLVIVCVGKGTKHVDTFMAQEKEYTGSLRLGESTPSYDKESAVDATSPWEHITDAELLVARDRFLGDIHQVPPMFSAIKIKGAKLYELARKGESVDRPARAVSVSKFDIWRDEDDAQNVNFRVVCSKGTYIRSLAHDLGHAVGTHAHLTALRRERIGEFTVGDAWGIVELAEAVRAQRLGDIAPPKAA